MANSSLLPVNQIKKRWFCVLADFSQQIRFRPGKTSLPKSSTRGPLALAFKASDGYIHSKLLPCSSMTIDVYNIINVYFKFRVVYMEY